MIYGMSKSKNLDFSEFAWYHRLGAALLWGICRIVSIMPRWFRYRALAPFVVGILRLVRYRSVVIQNNLRNSFPEMSQRRRDEIMRGFYKTLAEIIVNTISLAGIRPGHDDGVLIWEGRDEHFAEVHGRDWVALATHYGCWEYLPLWGWQDPDCHFVTVYHPLKNKVFEILYRRLRKFSDNVYTIPMADAVRHYVRNRREGLGIVMGLVSDQSPNLRADTEWYDFLNQKTAFIDGGERLAMRFHLPVYYVDVWRSAPGRYRASFVKLYDGVESVAEGEITRRYAAALEATIRREPELWMWSHKRWKHTPEKQALRFGGVKKEA